MKKIVNPKCPYCHTQFTARGIFDNPLSRLYGEYCSDTVAVECPICKKKLILLVCKPDLLAERKNRKAVRSDG